MKVKPNHKTETFRQEDNGELSSAKQLLKIKRPEKIQPRTAFTQETFQLLPDELNLACQEEYRPGKKGDLKVGMGNRAGLQLTEYFQQPKFIKIYEKHQRRQLIQRQLENIFNYDYSIDSFKQLSKPREHQALTSRHESGNLKRAYSRGTGSMSQGYAERYYLILEDDINNYQYNSWFFFKVCNKQVGRKKFIIANLKKDVGFGKGMLVSIYSLKMAAKQGTRWIKAGDYVTFGKTNFVRNYQSEYYYFLGFEYEFLYEYDTVYFAMNQPYTYSRMVNIIQALPKHISTILPLCYTHASNIIPAVKLSHPYFKDYYDYDTPKNQQNKPVILILSRQHPVQAVGSFIIESIMQQLCKQQVVYSQQLLQRYDVYIIPMVNPDGVIHGNTRCNLGGMDLNRQWRRPHQKLAQQIVKLRNWVIQLNKQHPIKYCIDIHGHGTKLNTFIFTNRSPLLSIFMSKAESRFNIQQCVYGINADKFNTIRSLLEEYQVQCYTLENSLYGWSSAQKGEGQAIVSNAKEKLNIKHYNQRDYREIASSLIKSLCSLCCSEFYCVKLFGAPKNVLLRQETIGLRKFDKDNTLNNYRSVVSDSDQDIQNQKALEDIQASELDPIAKKKTKRTFNRFEKCKVIGKGQPETTKIQSKTHGETKSCLKNISTKRQSNKNLPTLQRQKKISAFRNAFQLKTYGSVRISNKRSQNKQTQLKVSQVTLRVQPQQEMPTKVTSALYGDFLQPLNYFLPRESLKRQYQPKHKKVNSHTLSNKTIGEYFSPKAKDLLIFRANPYLPPKNKRNLKLLFSQQNITSALDKSQEKRSYFGKIDCSHQIEKFIQAGNSHQRPHIPQDTNAFHSQFLNYQISQPTNKKEF